MKRLFDLSFSTAALIVFSPFLAVICYLVWRQDKHSPFYIAPRVGLNGKVYSMVKLRSMIVNADRSGVDSTSANDRRITPIGHFIRRYKLDEIMQLWNVFKGDMSLVGPRPNVENEVKLYSAEERKLLTVKPGITSLASIVFSDEGNILKDHSNPDIAYNQLIRPWKSRLDLLYIQKQSLLLDLRLIVLTGIALFQKNRALEGVVELLEQWRVDPKLIEIAGRNIELYPFPPPGLDEIVTSRE